MYQPCISRSLKSLAAMLFYAFAIVSPAHALQESVSGQIDRIATYTSFDGSVLVFLSNSTANCDFFWIDGTDPGFDSTYSLILTAHSKGDSVTLYVDTTDQFSGSSSRVCSINSAWTL